MKKSSFSRSAFFNPRVLRSSINHAPWRCGISRSLAAASTLVFLVLLSATAFAGSATWNLNANGDWFTATNWTPQTIPNGPADTATFDVSSTTGLSVIYDWIEVDGMVFNAGASAFIFTVTSYASAPEYLTISGVGITNNSGITQNFVAGVSGFEAVDIGRIRFTNSATAGSLTAFTNYGDRTEYSSSGGATDFFNRSSAGTGTFTNNGSDLSFSTGGITDFFNNATAASATLIANGGLTAGGNILFFNDSTGGTARVEVFGNGNLNISAHNLPGVTVGSIEGDGLVFLGANNLTVGNNNLSTTFSGVIQDSGSLTKIGTGKLVLTNANTYTGATEVEAGALVVNNTTGFGTGTGPVEIHAGTLGGSGKIAGTVTVGTGARAGAVLSPGITGITRPIPRTLTIQGPITLKSHATYKVALSSTHAKADKIVANGGVTIENGAYFTVLGSGEAVFPPGTVFTVIDNSSGMPIAGTFANLGDGSSFGVNGNTFQASYEGGDGNDLTLTVQ